MAAALTSTATLAAAPEGQNRRFDQPNSLPPSPRCLQSPRASFTNDIDLEAVAKAPAADPVGLQPAAATLAFAHAAARACAASAPKETVAPL